MGGSWCGRLLGRSPQRARKPARDAGASRARLHTSLVKPASRDSAVYRYVRERIKIAIDAALACDRTRAVRQSPAPGPETGERSGRSGRSIMCPLKRETATSGPLSDCDLRVSRPATLVAHGIHPARSPKYRTLLSFTPFPVATSNTASSETTDEVIFTASRSPSGDQIALP